ncbi:hypothetical protein G5I_11330 [Acromyrmex echinatior]|uniref:Gustatory receptor n=1 Tax=Acromyrmex echinatior TaxID=103372 RepID=F4WZB5_ACREC|nr:hypothetical protein G5I_11330 [Acromyrmex echinatior]
MDMLHMNCVCVLKACFKQINDSLDYLRKHMTNGEPYLLSRTYDYKQTNLFVLMQLKALMKQHLAISDTVQRLIMNFSLQFLSTIIMAFIEITFNLYYYLVQVQKNVFMSDQIKQVFDEVFVTAVIYETVKIVLVVWACQSGKNQILEINTTVRDVYNSTSNKDVKYEGSILGKMTLVYIEMLVLQMDMLYVNCVCVIKACFKQIDDGLVNLREFMINSEPYTLREINDEERNTVILMELKTLKKQHMAISDTVQMLNMIFTLQLLFTIIKTFIFITFNLYFCLLRVQKSDSLNNPEKEIYYNTLIANVIFYVTKIMLIVWACETSKNQAMEISTTVIDISNSNNDKEIEYENNLSQAKKSIPTDAAQSSDKTASSIWACETGKNQALMINTTVYDIYNGTSDREIKYEVV